MYKHYIHKLCGVSSDYKAAAAFIYKSGGEEVGWRENEMKGSEVEKGLIYSLFVFKLIVLAKPFRAYCFTKFHLVLMQVYFILNRSKKMY